MRGQVLTIWSLATLCRTGTTNHAHSLSRLLWLVRAFCVQIVFHSRLYFTPRSPAQFIGTGC
jgi:hypothetical protein